MSVIIEPFNPDTHLEWIKLSEEKGTPVPSIPESYSYHLVGSEKGIPVLFIWIKDTQYAYEPHYTVLPWATKRQVYKVVKTLVNDLTKVKHMLIFCSDQYEKTYDSWCSHGIGRKVGSLTDKELGSIHIYQVERKY